MGWESNAVFQVLIIQGSAGSGVFVYSPRPGLGNLVASIAAVAGTDPYGNAYLAGVASYQTTGGPPFGASQLQGGNVVFFTATSGAGPWASRAIISADTANNLHLMGQGLGQVQIIGSSVLNAQNGLLVSGGTADQVALTGALASGVLLDLANTLSDTSAMIRCTPAAVNNSFLVARVSGDTANRLVLTTTAGGLPQIGLGPGNGAVDTFINRTAGGDLLLNPGRDLLAQSPGGTQNKVSGAQPADFTQFTVTGTTLADITKAWSIPANDMEVGSVYELTVSGSGSTPAAATTLQFGGLAGATAGSNVTFGGGAFPNAVDPFRFKVTYTIMITATGAGGTFDNEVQAVVSETGNLIPGNTANFTMDGTGSNTTGLAIDTTVANVFKVQAAWGAVVAGGLTARRSTFRRIA